MNEVRDALVNDCLAVLETYDYEDWDPRIKADIRRHFERIVDVHLHSLRSRSDRLIFQAFMRLRQALAPTPLHTALPIIQGDLPLVRSDALHHTPSPLPSPTESETPQK